MSAAAKHLNLQANRINRQQYGSLRSEARITTPVGRQFARGPIKTKPKPRWKLPHYATRRIPASRALGAVGFETAFLGLPLDVLVMVCSYLTPRALLSLARASKALRNYFMSKISKPCWNAAQRSLGLPDWPQLSGPLYASLIFEDICQGRAGCQNPVDHPLFPVHRRICGSCATHYLLNGHDIQIQWPDLPMSLVVELPLARRRPTEACNVFQKGKFRLRGDIDKLAARYRQMEVKDAVALQELRSQIAAEKKAYNAASLAVHDWYRHNESIQNKEVKRRIIQVAQRLVGWGWKPRDVASSSRAHEAMFEELLYGPKEMTETRWEELILELREELEARRMGSRGQARPFKLQGRKQ